LNCVQLDKLDVVCNIMTDFKFSTFTTLLLVICLTGFSQTAKTIDSLEDQYQSCLDKGGYMLGCSKTFYAQMDSMLNVAYFKLRSTLDTTKQAALKQEQKLWLAKRDAYFRKTLKKFKDNHPDISPYGSATGARDDAMFMHDDNAEFVETRVLELLKRLNK
jgi:uncharacterized protein YecT (DUF1311 family)